MPASTHPVEPAVNASASLNALFARVVAQSSQAIAISAAETRVLVHVNQQFEQLTGWPAAHAMGRSFSELLRSSAAESDWARIDVAMTDKEPIRRALQATRRDGSTFWADLFIYPLISGQGRIDHWVIILCDVTEHVRLHEALRRSEAQHRLLDENISDLITICGADHRCAYVSSSCRAMLGYAPDEMIGASFGRFVCSDDLAAFQQLLGDHFGSRTESVLVLRLVRKNGTTFWAEMTSRTRRDPASHRAVEVVSTTRDVTKRRLAEESLRATHALLDAVYEAVPIGLGLLDGRGHFLQCNRTFAEILGMTQPQVAGRAADALLPALDLTRATIAHGSVCECECTNAQGGSVPAELSVVPLTAAGAAQRLVVLTDLRERRKMEARLREATHLESLGTLAGGIAHDFNNLLAIVLGYASLLKDAANEPARINHYADTIIDAGRRGSDVVRQLQLFANTQDAELAPTDMHALLSDALERASAAWPRTIEVVKAFGATDATLTADPHQLTQAVQKLLENAMDAMPDGGRLVVRTSEVRQAHFSPASSKTEQKHFLRVSVEDSGRGMDAATRARMFEPFFARSKNPETRGLGLAVVYGIMRAHHGLIEVDSAPGHGTTVHLLFPRGAAKTEQTHPPFAEPFSADADRRTILLVEDEQDIGTLWLEILPTDGWRVLWARDGGEAIRLFRAHRDEIALVFSDIGLPVMDGWQVADAIRRDVPGMPLLIASGAFRPGDRQRGIPEPVAYLSKPYVPTKVIKQIRAMAQRPTKD